MKVLHISAGRLDGGAAKGAYTLHRALIKEGISSRFLTSGENVYQDRTIVSLAGTSRGKVKDAVIRRLDALPLRLYRRREQTVFSTGLLGRRIRGTDPISEADIVHLHWISGLLSIESLAKLKKPIVWTMRDMWPFTGGCHYAMECKRYEAGCGKCSQLGSTINYDLSHLASLRKERSYKAGIRFIGISNWLTQQAKSSRLLENEMVDTIYNCIDTTKFKPIAKTAAKSILGLDPKVRHIIVAAQHIDSYYKGFKLFLESAAFLKNINVHVLFVGRIADAALDDFPLPFTHLGFLSDDLSMRLYYSASDALIFPSRMEAFGKTIVEAMACGTPVVAFDATAPAELVQHKTTGFKANAFCPESLAAGTRWLLSLEQAEFDRISSNCINEAELYSSQNIAKSYVALYREMLRA